VENVKIERGIGIKLDTYSKTTSELFNKMKNLKDFYEIIVYIWENYNKLYYDSFRISNEEYKEIYTLYRNKIFLEKEIGKKF
jgi:hypothetical protein